MWHIHPPLPHISEKFTSCEGGFRPSFGPCNVLCKSICISILIFYPSVTRNAGSCLTSFSAFFFRSRAAQHTLREMISETSKLRLLKVSWGASQVYLKPSAPRGYPTHYLQMYSPRLRYEVTTKISKAGVLPLTQLMRFLVSRHQPGKFSPKILGWSQRYPWHKTPVHRATWGFTGISVPQTLCTPKQLKNTILL